MNSCQKIILIVISSFLIVAPVLAHTLTQPIKWAFDPWEPLHQQYDNGETKGLLVDIMKEILTKELNIPIEYHQLPWKRAQKLVKNGTLDFMVTVPTSKRKEYAVVSQKPVYALLTKIFTYKNHPKMAIIKNIQSVEDIKQNHLLVMSTMGNGWVNSNIEEKGADVYYAEDYQHILKMLAKKTRGDILVEIELTNALYIKQLGLGDKIVKTQVSLGSQNLHFIVSKKSSYASIMPQFDAAFKRLEKSGRLAKIIAKYID